MSMDRAKRAPSLPAADCSRLGEAVTAIEGAGADRIHVDMAGSAIVNEREDADAAVQ